MENSTSVFHSEKIPSTQINGAICGFFIPNYFMTQIIQQICVNVKDHIEIYEFESYKKKIYDYGTLENQDSYKLNLLFKYNIFGEITWIEKYHPLVNNNTNSIILSIDNNKLSFIQFDSFSNDFQTLALYALDSSNLNGKIFSESFLEIYSSLLFNYIIYTYNDNKLNIIKSLNPEKPFNLNNIEMQESYYDTLMGDKFFEPSLCLNLEEKSIYKIIKIFISKKYEENSRCDLLPYDFNFKLCSKIEKNIQFFILYWDQKPIVNNMNIIFDKNIVNVAYVDVNMELRIIEKFEIVFESYDNEIFDFFVLENNDVKNLFLFLPYSIQVYNINEKRILNIILNPLFYENNTSVKGEDKMNINRYMDLRGGGYYIIKNNSFIFSDSQGRIFFLQYENNSYSLDSIYKSNNGILNSLGAPYNYIIMPSPGLFFLSSPFADGIVLLFFNNNCIILDRIINYSPIINMNLLDDNKNMKFVFTNGYGENGKLNFFYDKFVYFENYENNLYDFSFIKSIRIGNYTKYLICTSKDEKTIILDGKSFDNITDTIVLDKKGKMISSGQLEIENLKVERKMSLIVIVTTQLIQILDPLMNLLDSFNPKFLFDITNDGNINNNTDSNNIIFKCKFGTNCMIISNKDHTIIILISFHSSFSQNYNKSYKEKKINDSIFVRFKNISNYINSPSILKYSINSKPYYSFSFIIIYYSNHSISIYDINTLLECPYGNQVPPILSNKLINEFPYLITNNPEDYYKCSSDPTNKINIEVNININTETPEALFFDVLNKKGLLCFLFKNGAIVIYELFISSLEQTNITLGLKKIYIEYLQNLNYKEFFMLEGSNIFIKFNNIHNVPGILININRYQKLIYEKSGEICILPFSNFPKEHNFTTFTEYSNEEIENGFLVSENGSLKQCSIPKFYSLENHSMLIRSNKLNHFPVSVNYMAINNYTQHYYIFCYFLIEKELILPNIQQGQNVQYPYFIYHLTLRTEMPEALDDLKFNENEVIVESRIVEVPKNDKNNETKKYLAVGVNIQGDENNPLKAKIQFYEFKNSKLKKVYENESLHGVISMIYSYEKILLVGEGSKINIYQYFSDLSSMEGIYSNDIRNSECKNLITCSKMQKNFLIIGDILESISWISVVKSNNFEHPHLYVFIKDFSQYHSTALDFWGYQEILGTILFDDRKNGHIFLIHKNNNNRVEMNEVADFYLGKIVNEIRISPLNNTNPNYFYVGDDGSFGYMTPLQKDKYEILSQLCEYFFNHLPFKSGLNPKGFFPAKNFPIKKEKGRFIDMRILFYYINLPISIQDTIANLIFESKVNRVTLLKYITDLNI
jgi:hypothetical protein